MPRHLSMPSADRLGRRGILPLILTISLLVGTAGCGEPGDQTTAVIDVALALGPGGLGDAGSNDLAYQGLLSAQREVKMRFEVVDLASEEEIERKLASLTEVGYDVIIGVGPVYDQAMGELAEVFPATSFALVDGTSSHPRVTSVSFRTTETSFVLGVLAGMIAAEHGGDIGYVGGPQSPLAEAMADDFERGVRHQLGPHVSVIRRYANSATEPGQGRELADELYRGGVHIIYSAATRTGRGVLDSALVNGGYVLDSDGDQRTVAPGHSLGGAQKRVDRAVLEVVQGQLPRGQTVWGIDNGGVTVGPFDPTVVSPEMRDRIDAILADVIAGAIEVDG